MDFLVLSVYLTVGGAIGGVLAVFQNARCRRHGHTPAPSGRVCRRCRRWIPARQQTGDTPA